jgi:hypothetical protein
MSIYISVICSVILTLLADKVLHLMDCSEMRLTKQCHNLYTHYYLKNEKPLQHQVSELVAMKCLILDDMDSRNGNLSSC